MRTDGRVCGSEGKHVMSLLHQVTSSESFPGTKIGNGILNATEGHSQEGGIEDMCAARGHIEP